MFERRTEFRNSDGTGVRVFISLDRASDTPPLIVCRGGPSNLLKFRESNRGSASVFEPLAPFGRNPIASHSLKRKFGCLRTHSGNQLSRRTASTDKKSKASAPGWSRSQLSAMLHFMI